ncbi:hypothetical protein ASPCADRAFT_1738 [Aspergillus carbonarius ITEM 5010]|uniref:Uncharacterized protein n=1 Tax=Aspergillus carbonarius (strain ITEM 5010) TaxID=602072 RepID=A0A1R3RZY8_ASPC5|nr:hypothetical protein ASPCADRAFT_1738 [Aspergillus carbonarius ITEM 5010]
MRSLSLIVRGQHNMIIFRKQPYEVLDVDSLFAFSTIARPMIVSNVIGWYPARRRFSSISVNKFSASPMTRRWRSSSMINGINYHALAVGIPALQIRCDGFEDH